MLIIKWNGIRKHQITVKEKNTVMNTVLLPGENEVTESLWNKIKYKCSKYVESGKIEVIEPKKEPEKKLGNKTKEDENAVT